MKTQQTPDFSLENQIKNSERDNFPETILIAGVDEVGRGPLAGVVVAAAVIFENENELPSGINDSKKLSGSKRENLYDAIIKTSHYGIGMASVEEIDKINILNASKLAMIRAVSNLPVKPHYILVDGNQPPDFNNLSKDKIIAIVKGDSKSISIAAASIIAKVTRDRLMTEISKDYPQYNWQKNAGYGTKEHLSAIKQYGITIHHRKSFSLKAIPA